MVDNPIDILNHIFQSVIVFMSEGNLCLLLDVGLKKLWELSMIVGYFLGLYLLFDHLYLFCCF